MSEFIDITPAGAKTAEGCKRIQEAGEALNDSVTNCANMLCELVDALTHHGYGFEGNLRRCGVDGDEADYLDDECERLLVAWRKAGDSYLRALSGCSND